MREARRKYEARTSRLEEIDDKALRVSRTATLVVGFAVSAVSVGGTTAVLQIPSVHLLLLAIGLSLMLVSAVFGVGVATVTEYPVGIGRRERGELQTRPHRHQQGLCEQIETYESMIHEVAVEVQRHVIVLDSVQLSLMFGSGSLFVASAGYVSLQFAVGVVSIGDAGIVLQILSVLPPLLLFLGMTRLTEKINIRESQMSKHD